MLFAFIIISLSNNLVWHVQLVIEHHMQVPYRVSSSLEFSEHRIYSLTGKFNSGTLHYQQMTDHQKWNALLAFLVEIIKFLYQLDSLFGVNRMLLFLAKYMEYFVHLYFALPDFAYIWRDCFIYRTQNNLFLSDLYVTENNILSPVINISLIDDVLRFFLSGPVHIKLFFV